jgi:hypothetical protein
MAELPEVSLHVEGGDPENTPPPSPQPTVVEVPIIDPNLTTTQMRSAVRDIVETKLEEVSQQSEILTRVEAIQAGQQTVLELLASTQTMLTAIIGLNEALTIGLLSEEAQVAQAELIAEETADEIKPKKAWFL